MERFNCTNKKELDNFLYYSKTHDGVFKQICYDPMQKQMEVSIKNDCWGGGLNITFVNIKRVLFVNDNKWGNNEEILSLTIEDDKELLKDYTDFDMNNYIYLVFQMFSGNEIHILSEEVLAENL